MTKRCWSPNIVICNCVPIYRIDKISALMDSSLCARIALHFLLFVNQYRIDNQLRRLLAASKMVSTMIKSPWHFRNICSIVFSFIFGFLRLPIAMRLDDHYNPLHPIAIDFWFFLFPLPLLPLSNRLPNHASLCTLTAALSLMLSTRIPITLFAQVYLLLL